MNRAQGQTVSWSGGSANTWVIIQGQSVVTGATGQVSTNFECLADWSLGRFTVPSWVLLAMAPGSGSLTVGNQTTPQSFSASGLDVGYGYAETLIGEPVTYQ